MGNYLTDLAAKTNNLVQLIQPRPVSIFEPVKVTGMVDGDWTALEIPAISDQNQTTPVEYAEPMPVEAPLQHKTEQEKREGPWITESQPHPGSAEVKHPEPAAGPPRFRPQTTQPNAARPELDLQTTLIFEHTTPVEFTAMADVKPPPPRGTRQGIGRHPEKIRQKAETGESNVAKPEPRPPGKADYHEELDGQPTVRTPNIMMASASRPDSQEAIPPNLGPLRPDDSRHTRRSSKEQGDDTPRAIDYQRVLIPTSGEPEYPRIEPSAKSRQMEESRRQGPALFQPVIKDTAATPKAAPNKAPIFRPLITPRSVAATPDAPLESASAPLSIQVTIGRLEVRATTAVASPPKPKGAPRSISLDEYLGKRKGGGN